MTSVRVLKARHRDAPVAFVLKPGEDAQGITGVVVTTTAGKAEVSKATELGSQRLRVVPGEIVFILHYEGEGYSKFWLRGHVDSEQIPDAEDPAEDWNLHVRIVTRPETRW